MRTLLDLTDPSARAVYDESVDRFLTYGELLEMVTRAQNVLSTLPRPALAVQVASNGIGAIAAYIAALRSGIPLLLADPDSPARHALLETYQPNCLFLETGAPAPAGYSRVGVVGRGDLAVWTTQAAYALQPHPDLAVLLPTSGSTGNPKVVRLSYGNLEANARSIGKYLQLGPGEVAIQNLPMHYSYGLSIVNSHLLAGGALAPTSRSFLQRDFWTIFDRAACTSFAGVPYVYESLHRVRLNPGDHRTLRAMTQAGGHLRADVVAAFSTRAASAGQQFFVMYGQTEATARIAYVPPQQLPQKIGSIGIAIPEGQLSLESVPDCDAAQLVYRGPNVMLGYAAKPADLALGDVQQGVLHTGDLARVDAEGFFQITGRLARFAKLFGRRIQLADVESHLEAAVHCRAAVVEGHNALAIYLEGASDATVTNARSAVCEFLSVPPSAIAVRSVDALPKTSSGKTDYHALAA